MAIINLTKADFLKLVGDFESNPTSWTYKKKKPCIVNFTASWCGYCKRLKPVLEELEKTFRNDIHIYNVDVDKEDEIDAAFEIHTIPMLMFCKAGKEEREMIIGTMPKNELRDLIKNKLLS